MHPRKLIAPLLILAVTVSCASNKSAPPSSAAPTPQPGSGVAAVPQQPAPPPVAAPVPQTPPNAGGPPAGGPPGGRRPPLTPEQRAARRDSATAMRTQVLAQLATRIAGYETRRSEDEFTNIQIMKDTTAANLLKTMDYFGKSLGVGCTYCHVGDGKWDDDSKDEKQTARIMINMVNLINREGLSKMPPNRSGRTPVINCVTCHRGNTGPGTALLP